MRLKPIAVLTHALAGTVLAACAMDPSAVAPRYATRLEDLPALQPAPAVGAPAAAPLAEPEPAVTTPPPSAPVSVSTLPPTPAPAPAEAISTPVPAAAAPARAPEPIRAPTATARVHVVAPGETLYGLARRYATTVAVLKALNGLPDDGAVRSGRRLTLPAEPAGPTSVAAPGGPGPVGVESRPAGVSYVVRAGDTLSGVSRRFRITLGEIQALNGMAPDAALSAGQTVKLPNGVVDSGPETYAQGVSPQGATPAPAAASVSPQARPPEGFPSRPPTPAAASPVPTPPQAQPPAVGPARPAASIPPVPVPVPAAPDAQVSARGQGRFDWPVRGEVVGRFGAQGVGLRNDGINIAASTGDPVRAAAAGEVVYAGDSVPGFGNLVLLKHADGWVTAYAHLERVAVKMREQVTQGRQVGTVGTSGGLTSPQLHFEVRYAPTPQDRATPIDPMTVLPAQ